MRKDSKDNLQRHYSLMDKIELAWFIIRTKIVNRNARLLRFPLILRGRQFIDFGKRLTTGYWCRFEVFPMDKDCRKRLIFGNDIQINDFVHICALDHVEIGDGCLLASHVYISDNSHERYSSVGGGNMESSPNVPPDHREYITAPVKVGKNVWIGEGVIIMPGVTIGDGCVLGAHSVVNKNIPAASIAVGSPAKVIKQYSFERKCWEKCKEK